jgi:prepilin-type N-terminal cleavage/methylation domain-containing protein
MLQKLKKEQKGFTIVEVMIVLVIAGLILLIVFLAVPALQRNSRNTQYKNEASQIMAAANEFSNNNSGKVPVAADSAAIMALAKTPHITNLTIVTKSTGAQTPLLDTAILDTGVKCGASGGATVTPTGGSTRQLALIYAVENSTGAVVAQCQEA